MVHRAQLIVNIRGDQLVEGRVHSALSRKGVIVEGIERRRAANGEKEHTITISFDGGGSLDQVVGAIGNVQGAAVRAVTLLGGEAGSKEQGR